MPAPVPSAPALTPLPTAMETALSDFSHSKPDLLVRSAHPYNAEPPLDRLLASSVTAHADFYVRSHGDIPHLDPATHRLRVGGRVATPLDLSLAELRERFPARTVTAVLQCAGNRRADLQAVRPTTGDPWAAGAIGNAEWAGVALADVLRAAGALERAGITCNKNGVPFDPLPPVKTSGIRVGSPAGTTRSLGPAEFREIGHMVADVLDALSARGEGGDPVVEANVRGRVRELCARFPIYAG